MNAFDDLTRVGIRVYPSRIQIPHFRVTGELEIHVQRFQMLQQRTLESGPLGPHAMVAHLVALDLLDASELLQLMQWRWCIYRANVDVVLELTSADDELRRLILSDASQIAAHADATPNLRAFLEWVRSRDIFPPCEDCELLQLIRSAQLAWSFEHLPALLFSSVSGVQPSTLLDHDSWVREATGLVPPGNVDEAQTVLESGVGDLLDAVETTTSEKDGRSMVQRALALLTVSSQESESHHIRRWLQGLFALAPQLQAYSAATALVVAFMADLIESGTVVAGTNSQYMTRLSYLKKTALPLHRELSEIQRHPRMLEDSQRRAIYMSVISAASTTDKPLVRAALSCFQHFLDEMYDIPLVRFHEEDQEPSRVRAQTITLFEVERMDQWLQRDGYEDPSLQIRLHALFWLCCDAPFRISEALGLRKENVFLLDDGSYEITVLPVPGIDLKSDAAARRVWITSEKARTAMRHLLAERDNEKWTSTELLFAKGLEGHSVYRKSLMRLILLRMLKLCTGDPRMTIHGLRHAWAGRAVGSALFILEPAGVNRLSMIAAQMGHQSIHTTWVRYVHLPERPLRWHVDQVLSDQIVWTSEMVGRYCRTNPATVRQRASRQSISINAISGELVHHQSELLEFPTPEISGWHVPQPQKQALRPSLPVVARQVLHFLVGVNRGVDPEHLAPRHGMTSTKGREVWACSSGVIKTMSSSVFIRTDTDRNDSAAKKLSISKGLQAKYEPAISWMAETITDPKLAQQGVEAWSLMRNRYGFLNLEHHMSFAFLTLLRAMGFKSMQFAIGVELPFGVAQNTMSYRVKCVERDFAQAFGSMPSSTNWLTPHPTRPDIYLRWHVREDIRCGSDLSGLDALLLALKVHLMCFQEVAQ